MRLLKSCTKYTSKYGKLNSGHRIGKGHFHSNPKEGRCQRMFKLLYNCIHFTCQQSNAQNSPSQASTVCEPRISRCSSWILKDKGTRDQIVNICWIIEKAKEFQENICFCFIDYAKAFDCVDHKKLWKIIKGMGIPDTTLADS